ncbi:TPA: ATP-binding protein, partial [bacterium]|nr:ATP-binding protein [bacterium]
MESEIILSDHSQNFDEELVFRLSKEWDEGPRLDFKIKIFDFIFKKDDDSKEKFIKLLIALANVSRRIGKPTWILFGVDNQKHNICDIAQDFPENFTNEIKNGGISHCFTDRIANKFYTIAREYISPYPQFTTEYGKLDNKWIFYIQISPTYSDTPFSVSKDFGNLRAGDIYVRYGDSNILVPSDQIKYLLSNNEAIYIDQDQWKMIIGYYTQGDFLQSYNLPNQIKLTSHEFPDEEICSKTIDLIINNGEKRIYINGIRGLGKSTLMHQIAYRLANLHQIENITNRKYYGEVIESSPPQQIHKLDVIPAFPVPIYFRLRTEIVSRDDLENQILKKFSSIFEKNKELNKLSSLFKIPGTKWVLLLDGLDELFNPTDAEPSIDTWLQNLPHNVTVIISSRPTESHAQIRDLGFTILTINPLTKEKIIEFIHNGIYQIKESMENEGSIIDDIEICSVVNNIDEWLENNIEIFEHLDNPRALIGLLSNIIPNPYFNDLIGEEQESIEVKSSQNIFTIASSNQTANELPKAFSEIEDPSQGNISGIGEIKFDSDVSSQNNEPNKLLVNLPTLAMSVRLITTYIETKEKQRRPLGQTSTNIADQSHRKLTKVAWESSWDDILVSIGKFIHKKILKDEHVKWCEMIGFLYKNYSKTMATYRYCS